ncbi:hypothetical protein HHK36_015278 [Tetracentron sinense]|uniref:Uncharacterized protein n=1 Tax=Tetracentron sinense TaxID=13715 RepID=A0A834Z0I8_TETSI|nr:hypothetical protein HHK36_015278 [Tetracentron sinense]
MMDGKVISQTQNQGQQIDHSGRFDSKGSNFLPTLGICYLTLNTVIAIFRAHAHNDTPMIFFIVFLYVGFLSLYTCFMAFDRLPRNEESCRKDCLKAVIWIISTALNFGLAIRFSQLLFPIASVFIFAMAITSSAFGFYFFFIYRDADVSSLGFLILEGISLLWQEIKAWLCLLLIHSPMIDGSYSQWLNQGPQFFSIVFKFIAAIVRNHFFGVFVLLPALLLGKKPPSNYII